MRRQRNIKFPDCQCIFIVKNTKFAFTTHDFTNPLVTPITMRLVIQRVTQASVTVEPDYCASIGAGLMVLVGVECGDTKADADYLVRKTVDLRIFDDENGVMNLSVADTKGEILAISQFTLLASTRKGNRPSYIHAARPDEAIPLYDYYCQALGSAGITTKKGIFGADMKVALINNGPVTIVIDSRNP